MELTHDSVEFRADPGVAPPAVPAATGGPER